MFLSINQICEWVGTNPAERKFVEGERVFKAGHIIKCGKNIGNSNGPMSFTALCLQTTNIRLAPHEIKGEINSEKITFCTCTCKAGLGGKCKHIVAALLYCYQYSEKIDILSCTDKECEWKKKQKKVLMNYEPIPILEHECFSAPHLRKSAIIKSALKSVNGKEGEESAITKLMQESDKKAAASCTTEKKEKAALTKENANAILKIINENLPHSALNKHVLGRHEIVSVQKESKKNSIEIQIVELIFKHQDSDLMNGIKNVPVCDISDCCTSIIEKLSVNIKDICLKTKEWYAYWLEERRFRITGSTCYVLFTYTNNKNADWNRKCEEFLKPKQFKSEYTEYGKNTEAEARKVFGESTGLQVVEIGLVVSRLNPWLAYSPDGIIVKDQKPVALLEIKCPFIGKTGNIDKAIDSQLKSCLKKDGENIVLKEKHRYYGQIQLGMAVLNLKVTYFVIYSKFDKKYFILKVPRNDSFISVMLTKLKNIYYSFMLHKICLLKEHSNESDVN